MSCYCKRSVTLPHGAVGWSAAAFDLVLHCLPMSHKLAATFIWVNPYIPNGISHSYQLDEFISKLRVVW